MNQSLTPIVTELYDENQIRRGTLDFAGLHLCPKLAHALKSAFDAHRGGWTLASARHVYRHVRRFSEFLHAVDFANQTPLPNDVLEKFREWLLGKQFSYTYKATILNQIAQLIHWCSRNFEQIVRSDFVGTYGRILPSTSIVKEPNILGSDAIKLILSAAYVEIDEVVARIDGMTDATSTSTATSDELRDLLKLLTAGTDCLFMSYSDFLRLPRSVQARIRKYGGMHGIARFLYPSSRDVFPFYLAVLCQSSANPMAMRELGRDCVEPHPLRDDRARIRWAKRRSGYEQKADFSTKRGRSAPNLLETLMRLNEPLVKFAPQHEKSMAFLAYQRSQVRVSSWQSLHNHLADFIQRHTLDNFDFRDLRRAGADLHESAAGSILGAMKRLNHRSSRTTVGYTSPGLLQAEHDSTIARAQTDLVTQATQSTNCSDGLKASIISRPATTVFGFLCKDPYGGISPDSTPGALCRKFTSCATCPGAIVPLDDPRVVAKLLTTRQHLQSTYRRAVEHGWIERFRILYEPTLRIVEDMLPRVSAGTLESALALPDLHSVPYLE